MVWVNINNKMMIQFEQKKRLERRKYVINQETENLEVEIISVKHKLKYKIKLIDLGNDIEYHADNTIAGKILSGLVGIISLFCIGAYLFDSSWERGLYLFSAVLFGIMPVFILLSNKKDDLIIANGKSVIRLFRTKPSEKEALDFANHLISIVNNKNKELLIDFSLDEEVFIGNLNWLLNMRIIDKSTYQDLKEDFKLKRLL